MEQIVEHVATECGLDATVVRERNFARLPEPSAAAVEISAAGGKAEAAAAPMVRLSLGKEIPASDYTLPRLWEQLKTSCGYQERLAAVRRFNAGSPWVKRGLGMTHTR